MSVTEVVCEGTVLEPVDVTVAVSQDLAWATAQGEESGELLKPDLPEELIPRD